MSVRSSSAAPSSIIMAITITPLRRYDMATGTTNNTATAPGTIMDMGNTTIGGPIGTGSPITVATASSDNIMTGGRMPSHVTTVAMAGKGNHMIDTVHPIEASMAERTGMDAAIGGIEINAYFKALKHEFDFNHRA